MRKNVIKLCVFALFNFNFMVLFENFNQLRIKIYKAANNYRHHFISCRALVYADTFFVVSVVLMMFCISQETALSLQSHDSPCNLWNQLWYFYFLVCELTHHTNWRCLTPEEGADCWILYWKELPFALNMMKADSGRKLGDFPFKIKPLPWGKAFLYSVWWIWTQH